MRRRRLLAALRDLYRSVASALLVARVQYVSAAVAGRLMALLALLTNVAFTNIVLVGAVAVAACAVGFYHLGRR